MVFTITVKKIAPLMNGTVMLLNCCQRARAVEPGGLVQLERARCAARRSR